MVARRKPKSRSLRLRELINKFTPDIRDAFLLAISDVKSQAVLDEVIKAIEAGDPLLAFRSLGIGPAAMRPITAIVESAFETGGVMVASTFPKLRTLQGTKTIFRFDVRNSRAEAWLRDHSSTLITRITDEQLGVIRETIMDGVKAGTNPRTVALDLVGRVDPVTGRRVGGTIGLSAPQQKYVANARAELSDPATAAGYFSRERRDKRFDSVVQKSIDTDTPLSADMVGKLTGRYSDSLLQLRGETIARTEAITSLNKSQDEAFSQAIDQGLINPGNVKRIWDSTGDNRVRADHRDMDGQSVRMNEPFHAPDGSLLMFPGDTSLGASPEQTINCRCHVRVDVDFLAGVQ